MKKAFDIQPLSRQNIGNALCSGCGEVMPENSLAIGLPTNFLMGAGPKPWLGICPPCQEILRLAITTNLTIQPELAI